VLEMVDVGLPWPVLFATGTILCQLVGSALVISNFAGYGWIGSAMLIVFTETFSEANCFRAVLFTVLRDGAVLSVRIF